MTGSERSSTRPGRQERDRRLLSGRRRAVSAAALAIGALAAAVLVKTSGTDATAAVPTPGEVRSGRATYYTLGSSGVGGNCSFPGELLSDGMYVAAGPEDYADAGGCGAYLDVTGPSGKVRVMIADKCPECEHGHLDLNQAAFAKIGQLSAGVIPISYQSARDPALPGPLAVRVKEGSSQWWIGFLIMNHGNPLTSVEYRDSAGTWQALVRQPYNYWLKQDGAGPGPFTLRVTDAYGNRAVVDNIALTPSVTQRSTVWMYGSGGGNATGTTAPTGTTSPKPSGTTTPSGTTSPTSTTSPKPTGTTTPTGTTSPKPTGSAPTGTATATSTGPAGTASCQASVKVASRWPGGYLATVSVRNTGGAQNPWQVTWTMPAGAKVVNGWNATVTQPAQQVSASAPSWSRSLPTGGSISVGIVASGSSDSLPSGVRLGGVACRAS